MLSEASQANQPSARPIASPIRTAPPGAQPGLKRSVPRGHSSTTVEHDPERARWIMTVFGVGYRFEP